MKEMLFSILVPAATRAAVQAAAGAGVVGGDTETQIAGAVAFGATLVWSVWEKKRAAKRAAKAKG